MFIEYWSNRKMRPRRGRTLDWMVIAINMKSLLDLKKSRIRRIQLFIECRTKR